MIAEVKSKTIGEHVKGQIIEKRDNIPRERVQNLRENLKKCKKFDNEDHAI